jgi:putative NADPH-quinone reductase
MTRVAIIQGHPDPAPERFCRALALAYAEGARGAGHEVRVVDVARLDFPVLRRRREWEEEPAPEAIRAAQDTLAWAQHVVIVYPLWLGDVPALLKAFLEHVLRPGFALRYREQRLPEKLLRGKSARIVVTMGMPGFFYKWYFRAHSVKSLERNFLAFAGMRPVRHTLVGMVESRDRARNVAWLARLRRLGAGAK